MAEAAKLQKKTIGGSEEEKMRVEINTCIVQCSLVQKKLLLLFGECNNTMMNS